MGAWLQLKIVETMHTPFNGTFSIMDVIVDSGFGKVDLQGLLLRYFVIVCTDLQVAAFHYKVNITEMFVVVTAPDFYFFRNIRAQVRTLAS